VRYERVVLSGQYWFVIATLLAGLAIVTTEVQAADPVNDTTNTAQDTPVTVNVLANGIDINLDAVFANNGQTNRRCLGDGAGAFTDCAGVSGDTNNSETVALGLLNVDLFLDAVFANNGQNRVCLGDGAGGFTGCADVGAAEASRDVALGLLNGDLFLDAVFANDAAGQNRYCLGNGDGTSACTAIESRNTYGVALGYLNLDTNLDAVFAVFGGANRVCLGDGDGTPFSGGCANVSGATNNSQHVALGLLNGDLFLDAVFANDGQQNRVCLGDGAGAFTGGCANVSGDTNSSYGVALGLLGSIREPEPEPVAVGGIAVPVNKLGLVLPWLGLAALTSFAALMVVVARRHRG